MIHVTRRFGFLSRSDGPILLGRLIYSSLSDAMSTFRPYLDECGEIVNSTCHLLHCPKVAACMPWYNSPPPSRRRQLVQTQWEKVCMFWEREDSRRTSAFRFIHHHIRDFCRNTTRPVRSAGSCSMAQSTTPHRSQGLQGKNESEINGRSGLAYSQEGEGPGWSGCLLVRRCR